MSHTPNKRLTEYFAGETLQQKIYHARGFDSLDLRSPSLRIDDVCRMTFRGCVQMAHDASDIYENHMDDQETETDCVFTKLTLARMAAIDQFENDLHERIVETARQLQEFFRARAQRYCSQP